MLNTAAGECGVLLVLDDLHWVDAPSIRLLQAVASRSADARLVERAEGNPLFVLELLRLVEASGRAESRLPNSIREVIGRRLERIPPAARATLRQAAVLDRALDRRVTRLADHHLLIRRVVR